MHVDFKGSAGNAESASRNTQLAAELSTAAQAGRPITAAGSTSSTTMPLASMDSFLSDFLMGGLSHAGGVAPVPQRLLEGSELGESASSDGNSAADGDDENSDDDDIFHLKAGDKQFETYKKSFSFRWHAAVAEMTGHLRVDAMLPVDKCKGSETNVCADAKSGTTLPAWHCPFLEYAVGTQRKPCRAQADRGGDRSNKNGSHEKRVVDACV